MRLAFADRAIPSHGWLMRARSNGGHEEGPDSGASVTARKRPPADAGSRHRPRLLSVIGLDYEDWLRYALGLAAD
jgi:hypothetical protein